MGDLVFLYLQLLLESVFLLPKPASGLLVLLLDRFDLNLEASRDLNLFALNIVDVRL